MLVNLNTARGSTQRWLMVAALLCAGVMGGLAFARLPLTYTIIIFAGLGYVAGVIYDPIVGLAAALYLGPLWAWLMVQPSPIPAHIGQYTLLIFLILSFVNLIIKKKDQFDLPSLLIPLLIFLFAALFSLWNPVDIWQGFTEFAKWAQMALVFIIIYTRLVGEHKTAKPDVILVILAGSGLLQACIGIWQFALRGEGPETFAISPRFYRAYGTFMQPNPYAGFVAMMASLLVGICLTVCFTLIPQYLRKRVNGVESVKVVKPLWMVFLIAGAGLLFVGLVASWSRGGWVGFTAAVIVMLLMIPRKWQWGLLLITCLLISGWVLYSAGVLPENITSRLAGLMAYTQYSDIRSVGITDANYSTLERIAHWQAALDMWRSRFWLGVGLGGYAAAYPEFSLPNWVLPLGHAHNIYLNMLAETGILGLSAYLLFLGFLFARLYAASRRLAGWQRGMAIGLFGAWTHMAVHNLVDNIMVNNVHIHMGVMLALSAWVIKTSERDKPTEM